MKTARTAIMALCLWSVVTPLAHAQSLNPVVIWAMPKSARIKCVTTVPGRMTVEYGTTPSLGQSSPPEWRDWPNTDVTRHYVNLLNLQPNTTYYYRVRITPQGGGADLVSDVRSFKTFRNFSKVLPTVRYSSYILGDGTRDANGTIIEEHHQWNANHYDIDLAYRAEFAWKLKQYNPDAVLTFYDNIREMLALVVRRGPMVWQQWAEQQGISIEHCALHYAVDTEVNQSHIRDRDFTRIAVVRPQTNSVDLPGGGIVSFPSGVGEFLTVANILRFDIVYMTISTPASGGYDGVWEYCNQVDSNGKPTSWAPLTVVADTTVVNGQKFAQSGYVRFIPPKEFSEWRLSRLYDNGRDRDGVFIADTWKRAFHIRFRVTQTGNRPVAAANGILNEDFMVNGPNGKPVIPGWDVSWENNPANNGDPEYNPNPPSAGGPGVAKSARFKWWSRAWFFQPDKMNHMTNVFNMYFRQWWTEYWIPYIRDNFPGVEGIYIDNFTPNTRPGTPLTPTTTYFIEMPVWDQYEYAKGHGEIMELISIKCTQMGWVSSANDLISIAPGDTWSSPYISSKPDLLWMYFAPGIANREMSMYYRQPYLGGTTGNTGTLNTFFAEMAYRVHARGQYHVPIYGYQVVTDPGYNTEEWWSREKLRALAQHLLVRDSQGEYLFLNAWHQNFVYGEPLTATSGMHLYYVAGIPKQKAYYIDAAAFDFGQPITTVSPPYTQWVAYPTSWFPGVIPGLFVIHYTDKAPRYDSQGNFLGNNGKTWYFARRYTNALVLVRTGESAIPADDRGMNEYTAFDLDGYYYRLRMDGTTEPVAINRINLLKHEGAILIPASGGTPLQPSIQITISADKINPKPLDVVTVTITATNTGNAEAQNVRITHDIPQGATYVRGSLKLDGIALPDPTDTTRIDVTVASIPAGGQAVVVFQIVIR
jgi:uncharacterized repeat protein (TIGR01451 family)